MISSYIKKASNLPAKIIGEPSSWSFLSSGIENEKPQDVVFSAYIQAAGDEPEHGALLCLESAQGFACDEWYSSISQAEQAVAEHFPGSVLVWAAGA
jgi:hypothetical protein